MDVGELLRYQPVTGGNKRSRVPEHFERRPRSKKLKETETGENEYQFKKILKKPNQANKPVAESDGGRSQIVEQEKKTDGIQRKGDGPLTQEEKERLLALVENDDEGEAVDESTIKKHILSFEKKVTKNQEMRIKFQDQPTKYVFIV